MTVRRPAAIDFAAQAAHWRGTVVGMLFDAAARVPDRAALRCDDAVLDYAGYAGAVLETAARLRPAAGPGGRVAVLLANDIDACVAHFAVLVTGAQLLPMNPAYTARELAVQLDDADCAVLVTRRALRETLAPVLADRAIEVLWIDDEDAAAPADPSTGAVDLLPAATPEPAALALLQYTGGTSGRPKGVELTHAAIFTNVQQREAVLATRDDGERILCAMPLFHSYGMAMGLYLAARCGGTLVILREYHRDTLYDRVEAHRITIFPGSPAMFVGLMAHPRFATTDWSSVRVCYSGAAALPQAVLREWEARVRVPILEGYGQTEAGPVLSYNGPQGPVAGSVGRALPGTTIQIVDRESGLRTLATGECGEIRAKGPQLMRGYRNLPAETAESLRDGWLYTGDLGEFDDDGVLYIRGRKKDLVIVGGYNVYPREVEDVLLEHPAVAEAAVVGEADDYRGEVLHAFVALRDGIVADGDALDAHCERNLARYKRPARITFVASLPKTSVNKIDKKALSSRPADRASAPESGSTVIAVAASGAPTC